MITDNQLMFDDTVAVTVTTNSTNVVDLVTGADISRGSLNGLRFRAQVDVTFAGATSHRVQLVQSAAAALTSPTVLLDSGVVLEANMTAGTVLIDGEVPFTSQEFIGVIHTVVGTHTSGNISEFIVLDTDSPITARLGGYTGYP